jgi:hypothetical protein
MKLKSFIAEVNKVKHNWMKIFGSQLLITVAFS